MFGLFNFIGHNNYNLFARRFPCVCEQWPQKQMGSSENRALKILLHAAFFISGITTVLIGQVLPILATSFSLNDLQSSYFFPAQFAGSILGTLSTSWFGKKNKFVLAVIVGCVAMSAGVAAMSLSSFAGCLAGFFVNGIGVGLTLPSINMLILEINPMRTASALSILNFCWGIGAIVCKPFVDATSTRTSVFVTSVLLSIPLLMIASLIGFLPRADPAPSLSEAADDKLPPSAIWITGLAWAIAFFNFVHVGFESGMGGWMTTYADRLNGEAVVTLFSPTFLYFLFFVAGRGIAPIFFRFLNEDKVLFLDLVLMLIGMIVILSAADVFWLGVGAALSGFGTSSVFPTNLSRFTRIFGPTATRRATPLFICGTLGATSVTWLIGFSSNAAGNLRAGMFTLLACVGALMIVQTVLAIRTARA